MMQGDHDTVQMSSHVESLTDLELEGLITQSYVRTEEVRENATGASEMTQTRTKMEERNEEDEEPWAERLGEDSVPHPTQSSPLSNIHTQIEKQRNRLRSALED